MTTATLSANGSALPATAAQNLLALLGRVLIAAMFVPAGFGKLTAFAGTVGYIASVGLPLPALGAVLAIVVELGAGIALLLGFQTRIAAVVLALFTLAASFFFHPFWAVPEAAKMVTTLLFTKNIAIVGGLLALAAFGAGRLSVDKR